LLNLSAGIYHLELSKKSLMKMPSNMNCYHCGFGMSMGSASEGMSIVLGVMADQYNAAMALCGIDTLRIMAQLPYRWSQVLTHKQSIL